MKLRRILAGVLTGAMMITGIPAFGSEYAGAVSVYADDAVDNTGSGIEWENIAKEKKIKASGTHTADSGQESAVQASNAVDGDAATKWVSADITTAVPRHSLTIDLEETMSPVDHITVKFDGEAWTSQYKVETSHTGKLGSWREVKTQNKADYENADEWMTNTFDRNVKNERMVLRRYVRFTFEGLNEAETNTSTGVAVSEVEIWGTASQKVTAPIIELTKPADGEYPQAADVKAPSGSVHHTSLADRSNPAATLIKKGTGTIGLVDHTLTTGGNPVKVPLVTGSTEEPDCVVDNDDTDGIYGFSTAAQTMGVKNKFDIYGEDIKVISFQLKLNKKPDETKDILGKGNKYAVQVSPSGNDAKLVVFMNSEYIRENGSKLDRWPTEEYIIPADGLTDWKDVLIVIDGKGKMRLYVDGKAGKSSIRGNDDEEKTASMYAIAEENPKGGILPFSIGYNWAEREGNEEDSTKTDYTKLIETRSFTAADGYLARLKFYTDKNYENQINGAGDDISDAAILSEETADAIDIKKYEDKLGVPESVDGAVYNSNENQAKKDQVYPIIMNLIQDQNPTMRITLCPYSRSTVWEKYVPNESGSGGTWQSWKNWDEEAMDRKFKDVSATKYRAVTKLVADEGFLFDSEVRDQVKDNVDAGDENAVTTVKLSEKNRYLTITTYYGVENEEDEAIEDNLCGIEELILDTGDDEEVKLVFDPDKQTQESVTLAKPETHFTKCALHENASVKITYALKGTTEMQNAYIQLEDVDGALKITPKKSSRLVIGHAPLNVTVTATLEDESGNAIEDPTITEPGKDKTIKKTETIRVEVDEPEAEKNDVIRKAPEIKITAPKAETYPRVADISISDEAVHHEDIGDRMEPKATFVQLTKETMDQYIDEDDRIPNRPSDVPNTVADAKIVNKDGIWAYSAQGQTPGLENKFDVYGKDVKVISFKLWLESWPTSGKVSVFGKGSQYAIQLDGNKKDFLMFMENDGSKYDGTFLENADGSIKHGWPEERYKPKDLTDYDAETNPDGFLKRWHNVFMVVDGKKYQRLYVDGNPSTTATDRKDITAIATDSPAKGKKPFMFGYNVADTDDNQAPNWWRQLFTEQYGYIADFEFYTNKNYYNMVNGSGDDISAAQVISKELADDINIKELEKNHPGNLDAVITNLLQTSNPAVNISVNPYTAKTVWQQKDKEGNVSEPKPKEPFGFASVYTSTTTLTAHEGFEFDPSITSSVKLTAAPAEGDDPETFEQPEVEVKLEANKKGEANKVLVITATYAETEPVPCTCGIASITSQSPIAIEIPEEAVSAQAPVPALTDKDVALNDCQAEVHTYKDAETRIFYHYSVPENDRDVIELNEEETTITAKRAGEAAIEVKAQYQYKKADNTWDTITNKAGDKAEMTADIAVTVTKKGAAAQEDKDALGTAAQTAKTNYPAEAADDYQKAVWDELMAAIGAAETLAASPNATAKEVSDASMRLENAIKALAGGKSEKGLARDELEKALNGAKQLYDTKNAGKIYTDASWKAFADAFEKAESQKAAAADAAALRKLMTDLTAAQGALVKTSAGGGSAVKDGDKLTGADGSAYQVVSAKDRTVMITKGVDVKSVKVGPTIAIKGETYKVIGIGNGAFKGLKKATKVTIDANVASIGDQAFANAKKLKTVTLGKDVAKIGKKAFFKCPKLNKVIFKGKALTDKGVGNSAFKKTAKKAGVKWGPVKGKARTKLKKKLKRAGLKIK